MNKTTVFCVLLLSVFAHASDGPLRVTYQVSRPEPIPASTDVRFVVSLDVEGGCAPFEFQWRPGPGVMMETTNPGAVALCRIDGDKVGWVEVLVSDSQNQIFILHPFLISGTSLPFKQISRESVDFRPR